MESIDVGTTLVALPNYETAAKWAVKYRSMGLKHVHWTVTASDKAAGLGKGPIVKNWNTMDFGEPPPSEREYQMGLKTGAEIVDAEGKPTGRFLVCIDVDDPGLIAEARKLLPPTQMMGGKEATPFAHFFYSVDALMNSFKWTGLRHDGSVGCLLELLSVTLNAGTVQQVMVTPSRHYKSGTDVTWVNKDGTNLGLEDTIAPAEVKALVLLKACLKLLGTAKGEVELVGRERDPIRGPTEFVALEDAAAKQEDDEGRPVQSLLDAKSAALIVEHAANELEQAEPGNIQTSMNALVFNAASLLAGGLTGQELTDRLRDLRRRCLEAFDVVEQRVPGQDFRKWEYTVDRAIQQGEATPRRRGSLAAYRLTDQGTADLVAEEWRDQYRYIVEDGRWLTWNGVLWTVENKGQVLRDIKHVLRWAMTQAMSSQDKDWKESAVKYYYKAESKSKADNVLSLLAADAGRGGLAVEINDLDSDPWIFCCANGTFDIRTGQLRPHSRKDLCTKSSPYSYVKDAKPPNDILKAMRRAFSPQPDPDSCVRYLLRWFGYVATGDASQQKLLIVHGGGQNGKSALLDKVLRWTLGDYAGIVDKSVLVKSNNTSAGSATPQLADLKGVRFGLFSETDPGEYLNEATIKMLTGSAMVQARQLFKGFFKFKTECKIVMDTNHLPRLTGDDFAIMRRVRPIPYVFQISDKDKNDTWAEQTIDKEGDDFLTLVLNEAHMYYKEGLGAEPACVTAETAKYAADNDTIQSFVDEMCDQDNGARHEKVSPMRYEVGVKALYDSYKQWAKDNGYQQFNTRNVSAKLQAKGWHTERKTQGFVWVGIRLKAIELSLEKK